MSREYFVDVEELSAALIDVGRHLGFSDEAQTAHLGSLGLNDDQIGQVIGGTEGYYQQREITIEQGDQA